MKLLELSVPVFPDAVWFLLWCLFWVFMGLYLAYKEGVK